MKIQYQDDELIIFESALFRTTSSLIIGEKYILLIDPNWLPIEIEFIKKIATQFGENKDKYLLFTHSDYDHIIGYGQFKNYTTIASSAFVNNQDVGSILNQIASFDDENYITRTYEIAYPSIDIPIHQDQMSLMIGDDAYQFFTARGHNKDGIITLNKSKSILVVGDYLSNIEFPYIYDSFRLYKQTLSTLSMIKDQEHSVFLIPGHGDYTNDKKEISARINDAYEYINLLVQCILDKTAFPFSDYIKAYDYPKIMLKFHQANIKLCTAELA